MKRAFASPKFFSVNFFSSFYFFTIFLFIHISQFCNGTRNNGIPTYQHNCYIFPGTFLICYIQQNLSGGLSLLSTSTISGAIFSSRRSLQAFGYIPNLWLKIQWWNSSNREESVSILGEYLAWLERQINSKPQTLII